MKSPAAFVRREGWRWQHSWTCCWTQRGGFYDSLGNIWPDGFTALLPASQSETSLSPCAGTSETAGISLALQMPAWKLPRKTALTKPAARYNWSTWGAAAASKKKTYTWRVSLGCADSRPILADLMPSHANANAWMQPYKSCFLEDGILTPSLPAIDVGDVFCSFAFLPLNLEDRFLFQRIIHVYHYETLTVLTTTSMEPNS